jgi:hypothetical protein
VSAARRHRAARHGAVEVVRRYVHNGHALYAYDEHESYPLHGDYARAVVVDMFGEVSAVDVFADELRPLFVPPFELTEDSLRRVLLRGVSP